MLEYYSDDMNNRAQDWLKQAEEEFDGPGKHVR